MKVVEKFVSINGEGTRAGELAVFVRFKGCNLDCGYCDTKWANESDCPFEALSPEEIYAYIKDTGVKNVTLTGGEPLLQRDMKALLKVLLQDPELRIEIETNGAVDLGAFTEIQMDDGSVKRPVFTMDYKLPTSGCEKKMILDNFEHLEAEDTVKFVSGSIEDLERMKSLTEQYELTRKCHVYISPVFGSIEPEDMVNFLIKHQMNDIRLQIQIHKVIWDPDRKGV